jgi:hypothetical protein
MNLGTFCPLEKHQQILTPIVAWALALPKCLVKKCFLRLAPMVASQIRQVVTNVSEFPLKNTE